MNLRIFITFLFITIVTLVDLFSQNLPVSCVNGRVRYGINPEVGTTVVWTVNGGTIIADYRDSVDVQWGNNPGIKSISYREINPNGCSSPEGTGFVVLNAPSTSLGPDIQFCINDSARLFAGAGFVSYRWNDGSINEEFVARTSGVYWVEVTDNAGCTFRDSIIVSTNSLPLVSLGRDTALCPNQYLTLDAGNFGSSYLWSTGATSQTIEVEMRTISYWVKVTDANGCIGADTLAILDCDLGQLEIPNAFTPGNDGTNDEWTIKGYNHFPNMIVKVYDRWGRLVYTSERGYPNRWDGMSKGKPLPMDTYYYIIDLGNGSKEQVGSVTIIR